MTEYVLRLLDGSSNFAKHKLRTYLVEYLTSTRESKLQVPMHSDTFM